MPSSREAALEETVSESANPSTESGQVHLDLLDISPREYGHAES